MSALTTPREASRLARSNKYSGLESFNYVPSGTDLCLECWIEYEAAERGSRDGYGLPVEPDYPASATLAYAEVDGNCIVGILSQDTIDEIETAFLEQDRSDV